MTAYSYPHIAEVATNLIARFGRDIAILTKVINEEEQEDPPPPWDPVVTWGETTAKAVQVKFLAGEIDGTLIKSSDLKFLIAASAGTITTENRIADGDIEYSIVQADKLIPGDTALLYTVIARK